MGKGLFRASIVGSILLAVYAGLILENIERSVRLSKDYKLPRSQLSFGQAPIRRLQP